CSYANTFLRRHTFSHPSPQIMIKRSPIKSRLRSLHSRQRFEHAIYLTLSRVEKALSAAV
ncbi:MAG: hypothetical protein ACOYEP_09985, partial [Limnochordia bacterium]